MSLIAVMMFERRKCAKVRSSKQRILNGRSGLGLFDVCPTRDAGTGRASVCGQTLNKPPGTKPRDAARGLG